MKQASIFYLRGSAEVRAELISDLKNNNFEISELRGLEEVLELLSRHRPEAVIVDASAGEREASNRAVELSSTPALFEIPILFLSVQAQKRTAALEGRFRKIVPIDIPFKVQDVVELLKQIAGSSSGRKEERAEIREEEKRGFTVRPSRTPSKIGGKRFAFARTAADLSDDEALGTLTARSVLKEMLASFAKEGEWLPVHAKRSSQLSSSITRILSSGLVEADNVQTVSLCFNWGFLSENPSLQRLDIFLHGLNGISQDFTKCVRKSAQLASEHLGDRAKRTLTAIGALIEQAPIEEESQLLKEAELALAVELAGRACWRTGYWSPHGAYRAMRKLQTGKPISFDKEIAWALSRVLADAAMACPTLESMYRPVIREGGEPQKVMIAPKAESFEATIPISVVDLAPGMRLAQHLFAKDGAVVLEAMTELDEDLITRIWRLLAIRPLTHPVAVAARLTNS